MCLMVNQHVSGKAHAKSRCIGSDVSQAASFVARRQIKMYPRNAGVYEVTQKTCGRYMIAFTANRALHDVGIF